MALPLETECQVTLKSAQFLYSDIKDYDVDFCKDIQNALAKTETNLFVTGFINNCGETVQDSNTTSTASVYTWRQRQLFSIFVKIFTKSIRY